MKIIHIYLISNETTGDSTDDIGDPVEGEEKRKVMAKELSIGQTEHYQAAALGMKPEIKLEIRGFEYNDESKLIYKSKEYDIKRAYENKKGKVELTCYRDINRSDSNG